MPLFLGSPAPRSLVLMAFILSSLSSLTACTHETGGEAAAVGTATEVLPANMPKENSLGSHNCPVLGDRASRLYYLEADSAYKAMLGEAVSEDVRACFPNETVARESGFRKGQE